MTAILVNFKAFWRLTFSSSVTYVIITSKIEITEVKAAINKSKKKRAPKIFPPGICKKTFGNVMNTRPGPAVGSIPNAKTAGKIATPASRAIIVSATAMEQVTVDKFSFLLM